MWQQSFYLIKEAFVCVRLYHEWLWWSDHCHCLDRFDTRIHLICHHIDITSPLFTVLSVLLYSQAFVMYSVPECMFYV